ncbi:ABC transporter permease [Lentzea tibetensis]|uniref:ABC transporter permease n=1 Tax=Lentzea tibetensis TaxID=2591470 RepID=A0A563F355_9PSEU|nr:ABC transporter permease [Lentzea tibetensis]TWP54396.1 ABC transporter permease [Lentzea tibetensis]
MLRRDRWALAGAVTVTVIGFVAVFATLLTTIAGHDPYTYDSAALDPATGQPAGVLGGISGDHWFGVEPLTGRDLFAIVVHGTRTSFFIGIASTVVSVVLGVLVGAAAGYLGGWTDRIVTWAVDVFLGFPYLVFMIAISMVAPPEIPKPLLLIVVIGFFGWPGIARIVRAQTLTLKQRNFVAAARTLGAGPWHVFRTELLPNLWAPIIVVATLSVPSRIGLEAALSFLGVGVPVPTPSWGRSISEAIQWVGTDPMLLIFPGLALFLTTWGFNVFGDGLRDALDPKSGVR